MTPVRADVTLRCDASLDVAAESLRRALTEMGARDVALARHGATAQVTGRFGSRLGYRLWGIYTRRGRAAMPIRVNARITAIDAAASLAELAVISDEGFTVVRVARVESAYRSLLATTLRRLQETLIHAGSGAA
jgi:hypothetical protein